MKPLYAEGCSWITLYKGMLWGGFLGHCVVWAVGGSGPAGGLPCGRPDSQLVLWFPACVVGLGWLVVWCLGVEDTPTAA